jgi:hypothetical protein
MAPPDRPRRGNGRRANRTRRRTRMTNRKTRTPTAESNEQIYLFEHNRK